MKSRIMASSIIIALLAVSGQAEAGKKRHYTSGDSYTDTARVVRVKPIYRMVEVTRPYKECWSKHDAHHHRHYDKHDKKIVGGKIISGDKQKTFYKHNNGESSSVSGKRISTTKEGHKRHYRDDHKDRRCRTEYETYSEERLKGYKVVYRYKGQTYKTRMDHDPGDHIKVRVSVKPIVH